MSPPFDWDLLQSFLAVARTGRLTGAARQLKIDHSTLGRRLAALEAALGARLFDRRVSGYALTAQGERLLQQAEQIESTVFAIQSDVADSRMQVSGAVRIGAPDGFGTAILAPAIGRLAQAHPDLDIHLVVTPRSFSLSRREADIAIGLSCPAHGRLHARRLTDYELGIYGARTHAALWRDVARADDLAGRPFIGYIEDLIFAPELDYVPSISRAIAPRIRSSNLLAQMQATRAGAGLCVLPCFLADGEDDLVRVLPDEVRLLRTFWMMIHGDMRDLARIQVTATFIAEEVRRASARFLPRAGLTAGDAV
ncbi:LysR family transcriptional regulator [Rhodovastum atsumiense]|uniref:LysR family transcriptional regulator n=1 Tax=Rhodovastum atsumiense TaxID=504468 RepID=A0A5M6ITG4_9PROT|nr:LysR family transcriptional regulator [Rhodovastum atsumiense]KAA5611209.1 LysR family transcriptional regulator [Rhodovastum atsumiense]CAH2602481.1 LysR family transcriptional regulator [Rhodovastum atsumiense]